MENRLRNKLGFIMFFFVVFALLIGGFIYTNYTINEKKYESRKKKLETVDYRIDKKKDYIYYINEEELSSDAEIDYKDVVINLESAKVINEALEKENKMYKENIKYISDQPDLTEEIIKYNNNNIFQMTFRDYKNYEFGKYISLVINEYNYSCYSDVTFNKSITYVFNKDENKLLSDDDLLNMYSTNIDKIKDKVREYLSSKQSVIDEVEVIKIDETIDNLEYSLYINEYGKLCVSLLVKTTQVDYNEIVEV